MWVCVGMCGYVWAWVLALQDRHVSICRYFPKIFGPDDNEPLNNQKATEAFQVLTNEVSDKWSYMYCTNGWLFLIRGGGEVVR